MKTTINSNDILFGDSRKGKQWAKVITSVDESKSNGYAFEGEFCKKHGEAEYEIGSVILSVGFTGSWKNGSLEGRLYRVQDGSLELIYEDEYSNIISLRQAAIKALGEEKSQFDGIPDTDLIRELNKRGFTVVSEGSEGSEVETPEPEQSEDEINLGNVNRAAEEQINSCLKSEPLSVEANPHFGKNTPVRFVVNLFDTPMIEAYHGVGSGKAFFNGSNEMVCFYYGKDHYGYEPKPDNIPEGLTSKKVDFSSTQICIYE